MAIMNVLVGANVGQVSEIMWTWSAPYEGWGSHCSNRLCGNSQPGLCGGESCLTLLCLPTWMHVDPCFKVSNALVSAEAFS